MNCSLSMNRVPTTSSAVATETRIISRLRYTGKKRRLRGITKLMYAAQQGNIDLINEIIQKKSSTLYERDRTGKTPLHYCCNSDNICAAQGADIILMAAPDLVDGKDEDGFTPLHLAVIAGNLQLVTFLLANNADVNAVDNEKHTIVHWATVCGETTALRAVLAAGAPVSTPDIHGGYPLHYAAQMCGGDRESTLGLQVLQVLLIDRNISVSVCDGDKRQPLLWAASAGSARAVLALVKAGADVEAADKDGLTALHCAASRGHTDCMDTLLTLCGASVDIIDSNGCTALHYAVTLGHADATTLLLAHGADPNRQDRKGRSPAHCGCAKGQFETVKLIGSHKANLWLRNARGDLPLHDAAASGRRELVKWLLEMRPSYVNSRNNDGKCPLHIAALHDNADMCKIFLDTGAQINPVLRTSKNILMTPLDCALQRGFRSTAKYLQLHGGVPASRLSEPRNNPINSALNLQIREDITFVGDTSTDSERENGITEARKLNRKKAFSKLGRKRISISGSDAESVVLKSGKHSIQREKSSGNFREQKRCSRLDTAASTRSSGQEMAPSSRLDYSNEIIINGKTEINIRQSGEIIFEKEKQHSNEVVKSDGSRITSLATEQDRRPRSAKYNILRERSSRKSVEHIRTVRDEETSPETIIQQQDSRKLFLKDQSTNTSEETIETIIENKKFTSVAQTITEEESTSGEKTHKQDSTKIDQQSIISNTSEDAEDSRRDLVVEVAVHAPPKPNEEMTIQQEKIDKVDPEQETGESTKLQEVGKMEYKLELDCGNGFVRRDNLVVDKKDQEIYEFKDQSSLQVPQISATTVSVENVAEEQTGNIVKEENENSADICDEPPLNREAENIYEKDEMSAIEKEKEDRKEPTKSERDNERIGEKIDASYEEEMKSCNEERKIESDDVEYHKLATDAVKGAFNVSAKEADDNTINIDGDEKHGEDYSDQMKDLEIKYLEKTENTIVENSQLIAKETPIVDNSKNQSASFEEKENGSKDDVIENTEGSENKKTQDLHKLNRMMKDESKETYEESSCLSDDSDKRKSHRSFRVLDVQETDRLDTKPKEYRLKKNKADKSRSRSVENEPISSSRNVLELKKSKIPKPLNRSTISKSDKHLNSVSINKELGSRVPSLPNISDGKHHPKESTRCETNMSAPLLNTFNSDNDRDSLSEVDETRDVMKPKRFVKKRPKSRDARSAGSDYDVMDSGFEPSPRSTRMPKWKNMSERGVNMTSVTQNIQSNIRRYHLERKIFQQLLELKRNQIRAGQHNESILVKRAIDAYHNSCASTVGAGRYVPHDYTFKSFEKFLYEALRKLQKDDAGYLKGLPATTQMNPLLCTRNTNRCMHAAHAYTGVPCAAYLPKMDHHSIPKIGFNSVDCKPGSGFLPSINSKKAVTLELSHGNDKQIISLPTEKLDENKRYYVTFTVKGHEASDDIMGDKSAHRHSRSN